VRGFGDSVPVQVVLHDGDGVFLGELRPRERTAQQTQRQVQRQLGRFFLSCKRVKVTNRCANATKLMW
jgi:hypothetical protein